MASHCNSQQSVRYGACRPGLPPVRLDGCLFIQYRSLESGLEILCRPPGKKPQVLTLLSGGEKALTAMALMFAVLLTNPSPICVLGEVDAPPATPTWTGSAP